MSHTPGALTSDYDFHLPPALIAQHPTERRDGSRMMVVERESGRISHRRFHDLTGLIPAGDALVLNTTRVLHARLLGRRDSGAPAEVFLLRPLGDGRYEAMVSPGGKLRPGRVVHVSPELDVEIESVTDRRTRVVRLITDLQVDDAIERFGHVPLPPYIARADAPDDEERYQTVYARESGSVAAPTAGLHFTPTMLDTLATNGVRRADVLLHVGAGTFKPVDVEDPAEHLMHEEWYDLPESSARTLNQTRDGGGNVWAVGTTSLRTLESVVDDRGRFRAASGETRIFIRPPHSVRGADRLITNFHLPRSTLLMLVAAFAGYDLMREAYRVAVAEGYRFYSYGDSMAVI